MKCYHCGATLTQHDFCTACKSDVKQYKRIIEASNRKYNEGLEKAQVRDLTGAVIALKQCLRLNKEHIDARNLLGLIYFETGEIVYAMSEWVISKNLQKDKNIAGNYITLLKNNKAKLDVYNQAIYKYNKALDLCRQGSDDLAIIQLKKIATMNPSFIKAHLLLAVVYMDHEEWEKAYSILKRVTQIDHGNTQAQGYLKEISKMTRPKSGKPIMKPKDSVVRYERDNETIIQPAQVIEPNTNKNTLTGFVVGFLLGAAILFFLVLPGRLQSIRSEYEEAIRVANENKDAQAVTIKSLESQLAALTQEKEYILSQYGDLYNQETNEEAVTALIDAVGAYLQDGSNIEEARMHMDVCVQNESFFLNNKESNDLYGLYDYMKELLSSASAEYHYQQGYTAYQEQKYELAINELELAVLYYSGNADSTFYLASAYQANNNLDKAKETYKIVIEKFAGTARANQAQRALESMN